MIVNFKVMINKRRIQNYFNSFNDFLTPLSIKNMLKKIRKREVLAYKQH